MSLKKFESYAKVQEFLEDIYMYLNNMTQSDDDEIERQKLNEKRRELIENCKHIRCVFEAEFHPHDDVDLSSYLDMNGAGVNRNQCAAIDVGNENELKEDYINMSEKRPENAYDIYDTASPLDQQRDENKCPYTGLPAAHLKIMNSVQAGLLTRIEKKLFFAQTKDFYAGILEKWILLYPSKSNDMKPSECFYPKTIESDKSENQFNILTNTGKRYHFQVPNSDEYDEWMTNIKKIIEENEGQENCQLRENQTSQLSFRKLPSPPLDDNEEESVDNRSSSENYYGFNRSSNQTVINNEERLYEEPCSSKRNEEIVEKKDEESLEQKPPSLPAKTGKKGSEEDGVHGYDVPKPTKAISEPEEKLALSSLSPSPEPTSVETPDKSRTKVSEMTAMLSSINLVSPEEKRKSTHIPKVRKIATPDKHETEKSEKRTSPMKSWFSKQINKSKKRMSKREKTPEVDDVNEESFASVKGAKVNMIINQLEKNGQLKVLSKSLKNRKSSAFNEAEDYETVCVKN